jgi:hypothetical protein
VILLFLLHLSPVRGLEQIKDDEPSIETERGEIESGPHHGLVRLSALCPGVWRNSVGAPAGSDF